MTYFLSELVAKPDHGECPTRLHPSRNGHRAAVDPAAANARWRKSSTPLPVPRHGSSNFVATRPSPDEPDGAWVDDWLHRSYLNFWTRPALVFSA